MHLLLSQKNKFLPLLIFSTFVAGCSSIELADNRYDTFNADIVCVGGDCPEGLITSEIAALINERRERIAREEAGPGGGGAAGESAPTAAGGTTPVTVQEIQAITRKPDSEKTDRDREIEALLEELLQERRERLAREAAN